MMDDIILGIDLGTTFSVAAYVDNGLVKVIPNAEGQPTTPSVVLIEDGEILVGELAANQALAKSEHVVQWIKRAIGDSSYTFQGMNAVEISAEILKKIKLDCEAALGIPINQAVITCPAYFNAVEVDNTMQAGILAGFSVQEVVKEPTAAAVYYGIENLKDGERVLVCDLGGGTYDASILAYEDGVFKPLGSAGDRALGGHDWTSDLVEYVAEELMDVFDADPRVDGTTEQMLYDSCEAAKRSLTRSERVVIPCHFRGKTAEVAITLQQFNQLTRWRIQKMLDWTTLVLEKPSLSLTWDDIHHVLLVGGATRMRQVSEALEELTGKKPIQTGEVDTMVARGAAILGKGSYQPRQRGNVQAPAPRSQITLIFLRIAERNLGTRVIVQEDGEWAIRNSCIIPYGTDLPADMTRSDFQIMADNQQYFDIPIVQFDNVGEDEILFTLRFECPPGLTAGTPVHVTFCYDQSERIEVEAVEQQYGTTLSQVPVPYEEPDLEKITHGVASPLSLVFALDISGSMRSYSKIDRAKQAVILNAQDLLTSGGGRVKVGVVAFGSQARIVCNLTDDPALISQQVSTLTTMGTTAMADGLELAIEILASEERGTPREIVLVSDGMPNLPQQALAVAEQVRDSGVKITMLGIGHEDVDAAFMESIADEHMIIDQNDQIDVAINLLTQKPVTQPGNITWGTTGITAPATGND